MVSVTSRISPYTASRNCDNFITQAGKYILKIGISKEVPDSSSRTSASDRGQSSMGGGGAVRALCRLLAFTLATLRVAAGASAFFTDSTSCHT